jgi:hypothetical protein
MAVISMAKTMSNKPLVRGWCSQTTQLAKNMLYSIMKLHVSARSGHQQVSHRLRGILCSGVGVEIYRDL